MPFGYNAIIIGQNILACTDAIHYVSIERISIMSFFSKILAKLGLGKDEAAQTAGTASGAIAAKPAATPAAAPAPKPAAVPQAKPAAAATAPQAAKPAATKPAAVANDDRAEMAKEMAAAKAEAAQEAAKPAPISKADVVKQLDELAKGTGLNWKNSIADLLALLEIDHSFAARKELAVELGCPEQYMADSAKMNVWLHKTVLQKIAENGGNIPQELLD